MLDNLYVAINQITNLVSGITKKNYKSSVHEINELIDTYKSDAEHHLFRVLFSQIDFSLTSDKNSRDNQKIQLLITEIISRISKPNFPSLICYAVDNPLNVQNNLKPTNQLIAQISKLLKFNKVQEVVVGLCLTKSAQLDLVNLANQWVKHKLPDLLRSFVDGDNGIKERIGFQDISMETLHLLLTYLSMDQNNFGIGEDQISAFIDTLKKDFPKESVPVVLSGLLYNESDPIFDKGCKEYFNIKMDMNFLANMLEELGSNITKSVEEMRLIFGDLDSKLIQPISVARCICMFMRTTNKEKYLQIMPVKVSNNDNISLKMEHNDWNIDNFFIFIFEKNLNISKRQIVEELDCQYFNVHSRAALSILQSSISKCVNPFPVNLFYVQWKNANAQFSFLNSSLAFPDVLCLTSFSHKLCDISVLNLRLEEESPDSTISYWRNIDFIDALLKLSDRGLYHEVYELFGDPIKRVPLILYLSFNQSSVNNNLKSKVLQRLFTIFIRNSTIPTNFFSSATENDVEFVNHLLNAIFDCYKEAENCLKNLSCIIRLSDIILEMKKFNIISSSQQQNNLNIFKANSRYFRYEVIYFAFDMVIYFRKKNFDHIKQWIYDLFKFENNTSQNYRAIISYLQLRYPKLLNDSHDSKFLIPQEVALDAQSLYELLILLEKYGKTFVTREPYLTQDIHCISVMLTKLNQILNPKFNIPGIIDNQIRPNPTSLTKMSRNKLDPTKSAFIPQSKVARPEYSNFGSDSNFMTTTPSDAIVLKKRGLNHGNMMDDGNRIENAQLLEQELEKNMKLLLEGELSIEAMCDLYCNPSKNKREYLSALIKVLVDELTFIYQYPEKQGRIFSDLFIQILTLDNSILPKNDVLKLYEILTNTSNDFIDPKYISTRDLINRIITVSQKIRKETEMAPTSFPVLNNIPPLTTVTAPNSFTNIEPPPEPITEKVYFIINNVSKMNVQDKSSQLAEVVTQDYMPWFAQYIVMKRVTTEANFHDLFIQLIDNMADPLSGLKDKVLSETYRNIKILLLNMKSDLTDFNDRQILKNLGKFLGMITLSKNKPILHDDMNLKDLIYEAYNKGHIELHYVVPFVTKTLEAAKDSIVFRPPCPWTMAILKVLKELHEIDTVKLNLKFEVEILCRNLKIDFKLLQAAYFLKDRSVRIETGLCRMQPLGSSSSVTVTTNSGLDVNNTSNTAIPEQTISMINRAQRPLHMDHQQMVAVMNANRLDSGKGLSNIYRPGPPGTGVGGGNSGSTGVMSYQQAAISSMQTQQSGLQTIPSPAGTVGHMRQSLAPDIQSQQQTHISQQYYSSDINMGASTGSNVSQHNAVPPMFTNMMIEHNYSLRTVNVPYEDLNVHSISSYFSVDDIPSQILINIPNLKTQLINTMEKITHELVSPLYERCAKITISTVEQLVLKDFGVDCDINTIKQYAFGMCRNLTAGLCLVTAREIIGVHLNTAVKQTILMEYRHVNNQDKEQVDIFANKLVTSNNDICVAFLQKIVAEKAIMELERKLNDTVVPDPQKRNQNKISTQDLKVYENFHRTIPGFLTLQHPAPQPSFTNSFQTNYISQKNQFAYESMRRMFYDIERHLHQIDNICHNEQIKCQLRQIIDTAFLAFQNNDPKLIHRLTQDLVTSLMNMYHTQLLLDLGHSPNMEIIERIKETHMYLIRTLQPFEETSGYVSICKLITNVWLNMEEPKTHHHNGPGKFNAEAFSELLKTHVISLLVVDMHLSKKIMENNVPALMFTLDLLKCFVTGEKREFTVLNEFDLSASIDAMNKLVSNSSQLKLSPDIHQSIVFNLDKINQLLELGCLEKTFAINYLYNGISLSREFDDPPAMTERTEIMIRMWIEHYCSPNQRNGPVIMNLINSMVQSQIIHNDECFVRFLRLATVYVVERAYNNLKQDNKYYGSRNLTYIEIDAYAMLVSSLINKSSLNKNEISGKVCLLNKSLGIIAGTLLQEHEVRKESFHPMPFQRIFIMVFNELQTVIEEEQQLEFQRHVLSSFVHTFHVIRPKCVPAFVFSWLELISHRNFVSKILKNLNYEYTHSLYVQLLCDMFLFLRPYLENLHLPRPVQAIYKGTVSLTCLLMHDFPEILINYHSMLCTILPINCIQLRNIILCTVTKKMQPLPDVLNNSCMDQLNQMDDPTGYCMSAGERIKPNNLRNELDSYLNTRAPVKFLSELVNGLKKENDTSSSNLTKVYAKEIINDKIPEHMLNHKCFLFKSNGVMHYDIELMNNVITYLCITAVKVLREKNISLNINTIAHTAQMDIIQSLVLNLDNEGRFLLLNCMVNQLRFPNSHTYYFIFTILYLFAEQPQESVKEQITRVILERIIINRPHPWGLLFVMNELFKNPIYKFWDHKFLHCSEEIENILESVGQGFGSPIPSQIDEIGMSGIVTES